MKVINKRTGKTVVFTQRSWDTIVAKGLERGYRLVNPVPQPEIREVKPARRKKQMVEIRDLLNENINEQIKEEDGEI